jgi:hypothetical protein
MAHLLKYQEWQGGSKKWYANDTVELNSEASKWYTPRPPLKNFIN